MKLLEHKLSKVNAYNNIHNIELFMKTINQIILALDLHQ